MNTDTEHDNPHWQALSDASNAREAIDREIRDFKSNAEDDFRDKINAEISAKWGESHRSAQDAERAARELYTQWDEQQAAKGSLIFRDFCSDKISRSMPVGTRCVEWDSSSRYGAPKGLSKTGRSGIVEVITADSKHPSNLRHSKASRGEIVVRLLKKDGKPGRYITSHYARNFWPEGVDPNEKGAK